MIKVCGITNRADAEAAVKGGATALGFNFYPASPRYVAPSDAARIGAGLAVVKVGVFVNEPRERVEAIVREAALDVAQLHGSETPADYPRNVRVWKAARVEPGFSLAPYEQLPVEALLLDGPAGALFGGAGVAFDWSLAAAAEMKIVLAGGLDAANVAEAIRVARPWGVDVCSRIESAPGKKDHQKMMDFLMQATAALG